MIINISSRLPLSLAMPMAVTVGGRNRPNLKLLASARGAPVVRERERERERGEGEGGEGGEGGAGSKAPEF